MMPLNNVIYKLKFFLYILFRKYATRKHLVVVKTTYILTVNALYPICILFDATASKNIYYLLIRYSYILSTLASLDQLYKLF